MTLRHLQILLFTAKNYKKLYPFCFVASQVELTLRLKNATYEINTGFIVVFSTPQLFILIITKLTKKLNIVFFTPYITSFVTLNAQIKLF